MNEKVYIVTFNGASADTYGLILYLFGIFDSRELAEKAIEDDKSGMNKSWFRINEVIFNKPLDISHNDDPMASPVEYGTDIDLGSYIE